MSHDLCIFKTVSKKVKEVNIAKADNCTFDIQIWIVASSLRNCATFALLQEFPLPRCAFPSQQEAEITHFFDPCFIKMQKLTQAFGALIHPRYTYPDKKNIRCGGSVLQFLWHFSSISARVLALSLFATAFPRWVGPVCAAHVLLMTTWILAQRVDACSTAGETLLFALVLGVVYIFSFFNAKEERTRSATQSENVLLLLLNKSCNEVSASRV